MVDIYVQPSSLQGTLIVPPSKSHTLRAILFAALASGTSQIKRFLPSPDTTAMIEAVRQLGALVDMEGNELRITGVSGKLQPAKDVIQCGNSGQVLRFIGAIAGLIPTYTILTGDASIRERRPVQPLLDGLNQLGAFATSALENGHAPILIKGPITRSSARLDGQDSQPVSGLLIAAAFGRHPIELHVSNPGEKPWIDLTLNWFERLGIPFYRKDHHYYRLEGSAQIEPFCYTVPGDFSSAAFPIAAALLTDSVVTLEQIDMLDCQGDKQLISILEKMGAHFNQDTNSLTIQPGSALKGIQIDINDCIDTLPILAVIGCFAEGCTEIINASIARKKESDRLHAMATELKKMGANIQEKPDGLLIHHSPLHGATVYSHNDHRIALALTVAALAAKTPSCIQDVDCIAKSYPSFQHEFSLLGAAFS